MTEADRPVFVRCLLWLGETFNEPVGDLRMEAYWQALGDLPLDTVRATCRQALKACKFFPKPVELRQLADGSVEDQAELAWAHALTLARRVGAYQAPGLDDPAMKAAIEALGGWRAFCLSEDEPTFRAAQFKRTYAAMMRRTKQDRIALPPVIDIKALPVRGME